MLSAIDIGPANMPEGDYAVVEILGHRTMVGRVSEVERFGTKFLSVEPLYDNLMLPAVLVGGASVYQFTPLPAQMAYAKRPTKLYQLAGPAASLVPLQLVATDEVGQFSFDRGDCYEGEDMFREVEDDEHPL